MIDAHLDVFFDAARHHADGAPLLGFVEQEFLTCGILAHSFARLRRTECALERRFRQFGPLSCLRSPLRILDSQARVADSSAMERSLGPVRDRIAAGWAWPGLGRVGG